MPALSVDPENPAIIKETIEAYMIQRVTAFNTELTMMAPDAYHQTVMNDRGHALYFWFRRIKSLLMVG